MRSASPYLVRSQSIPRARSVSPYFANGPPSSMTWYPHHRPSSCGAVSGLLDSVIEPEVNSSEEETTPLLDSGETVTALYSRRWYLLLLFSLIAFFQTLILTTWGPIAESVEAAFSWDDSNIAMCLWMGNVPFAALCIPLSWLMDRKGFRVSVILSAFLMTTGAGLRCLIYFVPSSYYEWCIYAGQLLNGMAGPVAQGGGALFSNLWFPSNQRATSTAISTFVGYLGTALAFALGPLVVPSPPDDSASNGTFPDGNQTDMKLLQSLVGDSKDNFSASSDYTDVKQGIFNYLCYQAAGTAVVFMLVVLYFPSKPPKPPTLSAASDREDFLPGLAKLVRNKQFWLIAAAFCLSLGVFEVWDVALDANLSYIGISQEEAGWLGFACVMAGCLTGLLICRLADIFFRRIRLFLILAYAVSSIFVLWFILIYIDILPFDLVSIYAAIILSGVFLDGCCPLVYELVCEAAYPVGEGTSSCFLQMLFVLVGVAFTTVQQIPNIGTVWMNWCLLGSLCTAVPLLLCVTDVYGRADLDDKQEQVVVVEPPENYSTQRDLVKHTPIGCPPSSQSQPCQDPQVSIAQKNYGSCHPVLFLNGSQQSANHTLPYSQQSSNHLAQQSSRRDPYHHHSSRSPPTDRSRTSHSQQEEGYRTC